MPLYSVINGVSQRIPQCVFFRDSNKLTVREDIPGDLNELINQKVKIDFSKGSSSQREATFLGFNPNTLTLQVSNFQSRNGVIEQICVGGKGVFIYKSLDKQGDH